MGGRLARSRFRAPGRMAAGVDFEELADRHLGIDGRRFELLVPQELLDVADVGPTLQHVRGAAVPEQVA